ncbi:LytTR family transcriptional regulator DNA-binding domain-containing protein [Streptococcus merionis]|uniref:LytTR family transcriptional regulator DNA-binding domain-containing protein n=1 Tax=Streptococcus merionis TaxID=400065 RepID=UPI003517A31D
MRYIIVQTKQQAIKIMVDDIFYIRSHPSRPHYVEIITSVENYDCFKKLRDIEESYSSDFIRCHRNCLVNLSKIKSVSLRDKKISLGENGELAVTFSRRRHRDIMRRWLKHGEIYNEYICIRG